MSWKIKALKKSIWVFHVNAGACNNCDIEIVNCLTPKFDIERFVEGFEFENISTSRTEAVSLPDSIKHPPFPSYSSDSSFD